jgi:glycosyltransferase involved in cell wall biosynthesis
MHPGSGISQLLLTYSRFLSKEGIYFDYMVESYDESVKEEVANLGGNIFVMPRLSVRGAISFVGFFKDFFRKNKYSIVHSHYYQIDTFVMSCAYKFGVSHYISHSHNPSYSDYKLRAVRNWFLSLPIRFRATDFCACSQESGDFLYGKRLLRLRKKSVFVLPNAIDYSRFYYNESLRRSIREELNIDSELVIGIVGSLRPQKNQEFLLNVARYIYDNYDRNIRIIMVGDGVSRNKLQSLIEEYELVDNVIITGFTSEPWNYYNAFDCYVLPSKYEGFGLSLLEAQVNSLRCVCSSVIPDDPIVSNHVYKLSLYDNTKKWAEKIFRSAIEGRFKDKVSDDYNIVVQSNKLSNYYRKMTV